MFIYKWSSFVDMNDTVYWCSRCVTIAWFIVTWFFNDLTLHWLEISRTWHFKDLTLQGFDTSRTRHFKDLTLQGLDTSSIWHFNNLTFPCLTLQWLDTSITWHFKAWHFNVRLVGHVRMTWQLETCPWRHFSLIPVAQVLSFSAHINSGYLARMQH
jgi:hypothetical protein